MKHPFEETEYRDRCLRVRRGMEAAGVDVLLVSDVNNIYWLTGAEDWSFYTPLFVVVTVDDPMPHWFGRRMDRPGAQMSTWLDDAHLHGYSETLVQTADRHPCEELVALLVDLGHKAVTIGYEADSYYLSPRAMSVLQCGMPDARFSDQDLMINRLRMRKSPAEIGYMREAARIAESVMKRATGMIEPGVRQCDVIAEVFRTQIAPDGQGGGTITGLSPIILAGEKAGSAHPAWNDEPLLAGQTIALELGGARRRYCCGLARTMHLGSKLPDEVKRTADAVEEGMGAVLSATRAGIEAQDVHRAWQEVLDRYGLKKDSRIGYGIGVGFPPDWGEKSISLRPGETTGLEPDMTLHVILGMWMDGWGMELSETLLVTERGCECLTDYPRDVLVKT